MVRLLSGSQQEYSMNALRYDNHDLQMPPSVNYPKLCWLILRSGSQWGTRSKKFILGGSLCCRRIESKEPGRGRKFWAFKPIKLPSLPDVQKMSGSKMKLTALS